MMRLTRKVVDTVPRVDLVNCKTEMAKPEQSLTVTVDVGQGTGSRRSLST